MLEPAPELAIEAPAPVLEVRPELGDETPATGWWQRLKAMFQKMAGPVVRLVRR